MSRVSRQSHVNVPESTIVTESSARREPRFEADARASLGLAGLVLAGISGIALYSGTLLPGAVMGLFSAAFLLGAVRG